jgi:hypothetical protein
MASTGEALGDEAQLHRRAAETMDQQYADSSPLQEKTSI